MVIEKRDIVIVINSRNQMFVNKRRKDRRLYPNFYGFGAGGRIEKGETPFKAARRELAEETRLKDKPKFLFRYKFSEFGTYQYIYEVITDRKIDNFEDEWQWSDWMEFDEVDKLSKRGKLAPDSTITYKKYRNLKKLNPL